MSKPLSDRQFAAAMVVLGLTALLVVILGAIFLDCTCQTGRPQGGSPPVVSPRGGQPRE